MDEVEGVLEFRVRREVGFDRLGLGGRGGETFVNVQGLAASSTSKRQFGGTLESSRHSVTPFFSFVYIFKVCSFHGETNHCG